MFEALKFCCFLASIGDDFDSLPGVILVFSCSLQDICCSDGTCCPPGKTCGQIPGQCIGGGDVLTSLVSATLSDQPNYVNCPGSQTICADGNTCCKRPGGGVLCCPYVHVCISEA